MRSLVAVVLLSLSIPCFAQPSDLERLTGVIANALADRDYKKAERLAVSAKHWEMIAAAKEAEKKAKAEKKANTVRCSTSGFKHPGGSHSSTTVCR